MTGFPAFGAGMLAVVVLALLGSCAERPRPVVFDRAYISVPTSLRRPCADGPGLPSAPPTPRSADAVGAYANQLIDVVKEYVKVNNRCDNRGQRLVKLIDDANNGAAQSIGARK